MRRRELKALGWCRAGHRDRAADEAHDPLLRGSPCALIPCHPLGEAVPAVKVDSAWRPAVLAFVLPMALLELVNGWPMLHFYEEFRGDFSGGGPRELPLHPTGPDHFLNLPIVVMGLYFYLRSPEGGQLRPLGLSFVLLLAFMTVLDMKPYYLAPAYPMLYAGGAILIERSVHLKEGGVQVVRV